MSFLRHATSLRGIVRVLCIAVALSLLAPVGALAGAYTVSSCRAGWSPVAVTIATGDVAGASDWCGNPGGSGLYADFSRADYGLVAAGAQAGWRFNAPPDTVVTGLHVHWAGRGDYATTSWGASGPLIDASTRVGWPHFDPFNLVEDVQFADATWVRLELVCIDRPCRTRWGSVIPEIPHFFVHSTTVTIVDRFAPVVTTSAGAAISDPTWIDSEPLAFAATDRGGGLFRVVVEVDGTARWTAPAIPDNRCVDQTGARDFGYPVPCPTQGAGSVSVPANTLPPGRHVVGVFLEDAAGNRAPLMPPTRKVIVNDLRAAGYFAAGRFFNPSFASPRVLNGDSAVSGARLNAAFVRTGGKGKHRRRKVATRRTVRFGERPAVRGTLTAPGGRPISRATVFIAQRREGGQWRLNGNVRTDARGRFVYRPAGGRPDRDLRAVYFPFSDSHEYAQSAVLHLGVRAGMTLHVTPRSARNGQRVTFTGRILGKLPAAGIAAALQAKIGRGYRTFRQLRASRRTKGRFRTVYRFQRTTIPVRYRFRLMVVRQAGLPYRTGTSNIVTVDVRP